MSGAHTPGPWLRIDKADYAEIHAAFRPSSPAVAIVGKASDADMIAAAPDLLAALEESKEELAYFVEFARQQCEFSGDIEAGYSAIRKCLAALAKARGQ